MSRSALLATVLRYFVAGVSLFLIGPYFLGTAYSVILFPIYGMTCENAPGPLEGVAHTQAEVLDFILFLEGGGCHLQKMEAAPPTALNPQGEMVPSDPNDTVANLERNMSNIGPDYHGVHQFFPDDLVGNSFGALFGFLTRVIKAQFLNGAVAVASAVVPAMSNPLFKAFAYIFYSALGVLAGLALVELAKHVYRNIIPPRRSE
jgi:hypothetical protein